MDSHRPGVTDFGHVGLVVEDLDETVRFLGLLGFACGQAGGFSGEGIHRIIGLEDVTVEVVMARGPDGGDMFEGVRFHSPCAGPQEPAPAANRPGLRHVAFKVDDLRGVVDRVRAAGWETVGEIVDFETTFLLCYVRGPTGSVPSEPDRTRSLSRQGATRTAPSASRAAMTLTSCGSRPPPRAGGGGRPTAWASPRDRRTPPGARE